MRLELNSRRIFFLMSALAFLTLKSFGGSLPAKCEISGFVKDSINGAKLPFATIQVLTINDSSFVVGTMANSEGYYTIKNIDTERYIIVASFMGYNERKKTLIIQSKKVKCDFNLLQKSISLSEVLIIAERNLVEKGIEKTTINVSKSLTNAGGTATDVIQSLPSVDIDIDGNINYRGSDKVIILLNGEKSELVKSLDQIPAEQIEKVELINNPSAKYEAEGMSGIINIVLKSGRAGETKTTLMLNTGLPEVFGVNVGYSEMKGKTRFVVNGGIKHNTKFQTKEHLRENYENLEASNFYQYDRQDANLNNAFINSMLEYTISNKQKIGISFIGSKILNNAERQICYESLNKSGEIETESLKEIAIDIDNYTIDGALNYKYNFTKGRYLLSKIHYSFFDQLLEMNNEYYSESSSEIPELQNTYSKQRNKKLDFSIDYVHPYNDSILFETGYNFSKNDLLNGFISESYSIDPEQWIDDADITNDFNYVQFINAIYINFDARLKHFEIQAGFRCEYTKNSQDNNHKNEYINFFPSVNISRKLSKYFIVYAGYNRRINRPTIKMLNPFSDEYADLLNMHKGNPDLKPELVNSFEIGNRFVFNKLSGLVSVYFRDIDQAISRVKSASNDSSLFVTYMNLENAKLIGSEISLTYKPFFWWSINTAGNFFYTNLKGEYSNNKVDNSKTAWNINVSNNFKIRKNIGVQLSAYYRSKLPSVMGTYKERYYIDLAINKKMFKNTAQLIFKISDVFNTYKFGLDLYAIDDNNFRYSQINRRKNESRYFILSFIYNINGKKQQQKNQKEKFFLDNFDK